MQRKILFAFLIYFLLITYVYTGLDGYGLAWAAMVVPAILLAMCLTAAIWWEGRVLQPADIVRPFVQHDWQCLLLAFAVLCPAAAINNGSPLEAAASSLLAVLIVIILQGPATRGFASFSVIAFFVCLMGSVISYHLGTNPFGYLPWHEAHLPTFVGVSRVSLFPSLSDSVLYAVVAMLACVNFRPPWWPWIAALSAYFIFYSYSRTVIMLFGAMLISHLLLRCRLRGSLNFFLVAVLVIFCAGFADRAVPALVKAEKLVTGHSYIGERFIRQLATRESNGEVAPPEILRLYEKDLLEGNPHLRGRAELWKAHLSAFASSPLTGVGREAAMRSINRTSLDVSTTGSESFLTRMLAEFGLAALVFWAAIWRLFVHFDKAEDALGQALTIGLLVVLCLYGSSAVPYNFAFLSYIALIGHALAVKRPNSLSST